MYFGSPVKSKIKNNLFTQSMNNTGSRVIPEEILNNENTDSRVIPEEILNIKNNTSDINRIVSKTSSEFLGNLSDEDKISFVIQDPKFGMFTLFKYHIKYGIHNRFTINRKTIYCSHVFSFWLAIPILIFISQWLIYTTLIINQIETHSDELCPNKANIQEKLLMFAVALLYFCKSFFLWDNLLSRSKKRFVIKTDSICTIIDALQEFGFNILVYFTNLLIIYTETDFMNMLMNCLAMEFLMYIDNEFEETYFKYQPEVALDIFDKLFVSYNDNKIYVIDRLQKQCCFRFVRYITWLPRKLIVLSHMLLPIICFFMVLFGPICK